MLKRAHHLLALSLISGIQVSQVLDDPLIQLLLLTLELIQIQMKSDLSRLINHITSMLRWHSASRRRDERMRWK